MKFVRFGKNSRSIPIPGLVDEQENVRDLSAEFKEISAETISAHAKALSAANLPVAGKVGDLHLFPCLPRPGKIICVAFNSKEHTKQMGFTIEEAPIFFLKAGSAIAGARDPLLLSRIAKKVDWEAELGVVIGRKAKYVSSSKALDHVLGYCCVNDVSDRYWQLEQPGKQYTKGKSFDSFAPIGPYLVTKDEIGDPHRLRVTLKVNGVERQNFSTDDYKHNVSDTISYLSQFFTLEPGDLISMGSGPGNAEYWGGKYLAAGDKIEFEIESLGKQEQAVVAE